ncbi:MAG: glycosyltransferase [Kiritimatiellia bacterium]
MSACKIAIWHRYGPAAHAEINHSLVFLIEELARTCEIHYFGTRSRQPIPAAIADNARIHRLPFALNRSSTLSVRLATFLWYLSVPFMALKCRFMRMDAVYIEESLPLIPFLVRVFYGHNTVATVADFFARVYLEKTFLLKPLCKLVELIDFAVWRRLPLIFTKVKHTKDFLVQNGVDARRIHPIYNPCSPEIYFPRDKHECRQAFNIPDESIVLVHHGILHPNKGNALIIQALADLAVEFPSLRYLLVGSGPEEKQLKSLSEELQITDMVIFTGWLKTQKEVNTALNAADIGLVMRIGQSTDHFHVTDTLTHEMACGLPILAVNLKGIAEVIREEETGLLFDSGNMEQFKDKLKRLVNEPGLREKLGKSALETGRKLFDPQKVAERTAAPLLELVRSNESAIATKRHEKTQKGRKNFTQDQQDK